MKPIYPDQYLHVQECRSGQEWLVPFSDTEPLDLRANLEQWVKNEFGGELEIDGKIMPRLAGDYYAKIITDGRSPASVVVWQAGGFYLKNIVSYASQCAAQAKEAHE